VQTPATQVATAAEETRNPGRDLPIGIIGSLSICERPVRMQGAGPLVSTCGVSACPRSLGSADLTELLSIRQLLVDLLFNLCTHLVACRYHPVRPHVPGHHRHAAVQ
jgi:hypothetical protein